MAANGSTCQVSLSELSRLPVSNLRLSAHISAPWTRKKKKKTEKNVEKATKPRQKATKWTNWGVALFQVDAVRSQAAEAPGGGGGPGASAWVSAARWGLRAACQAPSCENRTVCLCSRRKKNAQLLRTLQNQLALTFTSAFWHFFSDMASTQGRASLRNVICYTPTSTPTPTRPTK